MPRKFPSLSTGSGMATRRAAILLRLCQSSPTDRRRARPRLTALLLVAALAAACTGGANPSDGPGGDAALESPPDRVDGGTVIYGADDQPTTLNAAVVEGGTLINAHITAAVLSPLWRVRPDFTFEPLLLAAEPELSFDPFTVTYTLQEGLQWSDGEPLTAKDVAFTYDTIMNPKFKIASRDGYDRVRAVKVLDDRRVRFVFRRPYGAWKSLFSGPASAILPRHLLRGKDFDTVWQDEIPVSSGPFEFDFWERGKYMVLKRNENFWGTPAALNEVVVDFSSDLESRLQAWEEDEPDRVDVLSPPPMPGLQDRLAEIGGTRFSVMAGPVWEYLDFNTVAPPLTYPYVRKALAMAIDRRALAGDMLGGLQPGIAPLNSVVELSNQPGYADRWSQEVPYDPVAAEQLLATNGCTRPRTVWRCEGEDLAFDFATTSEVPLRTEAFAHIARDLDAIGVQLNAKLNASDRVFKPRFLASETAWDLFNFSRRGTTNPLDAMLPWRCDSSPALNDTKYCNRKVDRLFDAAATEPRDSRRHELLARSDALIARDVPTLPLYQRPLLLAWNSAISGPQNNPTEWGPLWNVGDWFLIQ